MARLYVAFHDNGVVRDIATEALDGYLPAPSKATSTLALRYELRDGKVVDRFPGKSDEEVLAAIAAQQQQQQSAAASDAHAPRPISKLAFMERFTDEELAAIYAAAKTDVRVEVWMDKLKLAGEVDLNDPRTQAGVRALEALGLIAEGRAAEILA